MGSKKVGFGSKVRAEGSGIWRHFGKKGQNGPWPTLAGPACYFLKKSLLSSFRDLRRTMVLRVGALRLSDRFRESRGN